MIKIQNPNFSIRQICDSGQCFRMTPLDKAHYRLIAGGRYVELIQESDGVMLLTDENEMDFWKYYFDLDTDYSWFAASIPETDIYLRKAADFGKGIRILRQDLWEMIITFILSQRNNIRRIRQCVESLCLVCGEKKQTAGKTYHAFPSARAILEAGEEGLAACRLGYRTKYILKTARMAEDGLVDLGAIKGMAYPEAKTELLKLCGVGEKVADCICLFGLHCMDAFPVDTHIRQVLDCHYPEGFPFSDYSGYRGIMQQYIFYYDLMKDKIDQEN